ncbi:hypothetical protein DL768_007292 [Monosporascus sp. mg162]|nr:hypothetical protein DL768_007292 [Monosporascus sp. mg162]
MIPSPFAHSELAQLNPDEQHEKTQAVDFLMMDTLEYHRPTRPRYEEDEPSYLHYSIEWKWHTGTCSSIPSWKLLRKKLAQNRAVRCDETNVIVSVTGRSEHDLTKRFDDIDVDWSIVEKQLLAWGELFRSGKKLRVYLSFNYLDHSSLANTSARGLKRGSSATQQMLSERATQLDAEEESSG